MSKHISYSDGSNPYICFTDKEFNKLKRKYKRQLMHLHDDFYYVLPRFQLVTYCDESGLDENKDYNDIYQAQETALILLDEYEEVYIYDRKTNRIAFLYGGYYVPKDYFAGDVDTTTTIIFTPEYIEEITA